MSDITQRPSAPEESMNPAELVEAFGVLTTAVAQQADGEHAPTASEVRLAMKRLTYDGFDPKRLGFKRFRDFLHAAQDAGSVVLHDRPGDLLVTIKGAAPPPSGRPRVRRDLWKAALDWSPNVKHYYDIEQDRVLTLPAAAVPLEPEKFSLLRDRLTLGDPNLIEVPCVDIRTQLGWMERFASGLDDESLRGLLLGALGGDKPAKLFTTVLRNELGAQDRWHASLTAHVLSHLHRWREENEPLSAIQIEVQATSSSAPRVHEPANQVVSAASSRALVDATSSILRSWRGTSPTIVRHWRASSSASEDRLRSLLHRAIDRMPEEELRALRLPIGYFVED